MAAGREPTSSLDTDKYLESQASPDQQNTSTPRRTNCLVSERDCFLWDGRLDELKMFVANDLNRTRNPGGETNLFKDSNCTIKWFGINKKKLVVIKDDSKLLATK